MLTNAFETQVVQSLGVRIGPERRRRRRGEVGHQVSVRRDDSGEATGGDGAASHRRPMDLRGGSPAREHSRVRPPMARTGIEKFARERGALEVDEKILDEARDFFGM